MRFSELTPGRVIETEARIVTEREIIDFAARYDPQPFHTDPARAARSRWGGLIASGWLTCCIAMELVVRQALVNSESFGSPGVEQLQWTQPVRPGDLLRVVVTVLESKISSSGRVGAVRWEWVVLNQAELVVSRMVATSLFDIGSAPNAG